VNAALINDITIRGMILIILHEIILLMRIISLNRLIEGGAAILQIHNKNHHSAIDGIICINPLHNNILRDEVRSKTMLVRQNIPDEQSPWAIIRAKHPVAPVFLPAITPEITKLICAIDEYATRLLVSVWRKHIKLTIEPPTILTVTHKALICVN
jgi:hypothetical protein